MNSHIHQLRGMLESSNDNSEEQQRYQRQHQESSRHDGKYPAVELS